MRILLSILCILMLLSSPAAADDNPFDIGAEMVRDGFILLIRALSDESYNAVGINGTQSSMDAYVSMATFTFDPFSFKKVKELNFLSAVIAFLIIMLYIGAGAAWAIICKVWPNLAMSISEITDIDRDIAGQQYVRNIALSIFALLLGHVIIRLILILNYVLSSLVAKYTVVSSIDISSNYVLYFFSGLVFLVNAIFYVWRLIIICVFASFSLVLGAVLVWSMTGKIAISLTKYFIAVTFLQLIIVAIIAGGMIAVDVIKGFNLVVIPFAASLPSFILLVLLLMSVIVSIMICLGPVFRPAINVVLRKVM